MSIVKLYCQFPIKILFIVVAKEFGQKMTVQSSVINSGALVIRGLGANGVVIFQFELEPHHSRKQPGNPISQSQSSFVSHALTTQQSESDALMTLDTSVVNHNWIEMDQTDAETIQIASAFMQSDKGSQIS